MAQQYQEQILFQYRTRTNGNEFMWECPRNYTVLLNAVGIANIAAGAITYRLFANPNGGRVFTINNALGYDIAIAGNTTASWTGVTGVKYPTSFGIQSSVAQNIVVTAFGVMIKTG